MSSSSNSNQDVNACEHEFIALLRCQQTASEIVWSKVIPDKFLTHEDLVNIGKIFFSAHSLQQAFTADDDVFNARDDYHNNNRNHNHDHLVLQQQRMSTVVVQNDRVIIGTCCAEPSNDWYLLLLPLKVSPSIDSVTLTALIPGLYRASDQLVIRGDLLLTPRDKVFVLWNTMCYHASNIIIQQQGNRKKLLLSTYTTTTTSPRSENVPRYLTQVLVNLVKKFVLMEKRQTSCVTTRVNDDRSQLSRHWLDVPVLQDVVNTFNNIARTTWSASTVSFCVISPSMRVAHASSYVQTPPLSFFLYLYPPQQYRQYPT